MGDLHLSESFFNMLSLVRIIFHYVVTCPKVLMSFVFNELIILTFIGNTRKIYLEYDENEVDVWSMIKCIS